MANFIDKTKASGKLNSCSSTKKEVHSWSSSSSFFFFFFLLLTRPHEAEEWRPAAHFGGCFGGHFGRIGLFRWPFWPKSAVSAPVSAGIGPNRPVSAQISTNRKKRANQRVRRQTPCRDESNVGAATLEPHQCFPDLEQCLTFNLDIFLFLVCQHT